MVIILISYIMLMIKLLILERKFINQTEYNKWVPLLDLIDEYTNVGYPPQTFGVVHMLGKKIKPFIQQ